MSGTENKPKSYGGYVKKGKSKTDIFAEKLNADFDKVYGELIDEHTKKGCVIMTIPNIKYSKVHISDYVSVVTYKNGWYRYIFGGNVTFKNTTYFMLKPVKMPIKFSIQWANIHTVFVSYSNYTKNVTLKHELIYPELIDKDVPLPMPKISNVSSIQLTQPPPSPTHHTPASTLTTIVAPPDPEQTKVFDSDEGQTSSSHPIFVEGSEFVIGKVI
jgi:hypothetical protein